MSKLVSEGLVNSLDGLFYLSRRGVSLGSMGLKRIVDKGIPLPWQKAPMLLPTRPTASPIGHKPARLVRDRQQEWIFNPPPIDINNVGAAKDWCARAL